jgi:hypothetical protein
MKNQSLLARVRLCFEYKKPMLMNGDFNHHRSLADNDDDIKNETIPI